MSKSLPAVWDADAHTIAKIAILRNYLHAWFRILGKTRPNQTILYVDGFAGPGYYRNSPEGSPLVALRAAESAIVSLGKDFLANRICCAFIESKRERFEILTQSLRPYLGKPQLWPIPLHFEFRDGIKQLQYDLPRAFDGEGPTLVFADPFGGTDIPFDTLADCMRGDSAELLINLDADGIGRIFRAAQNNNRENQLTELFGSDCWRGELNPGEDFKQLTVRILDLYISRLKSLSGVKFTWPFAMRGKNDSLSYYLVFASKHPLGMEKMKEAMRALDKTGTYAFSDAHKDQIALFREDDPNTYSRQLFEEFEGETISLEEANEFALCETPLLNAKAMLAILETEGKLKVSVRENERRRFGSFPDDKVTALQFGRFTEIGKQGELGI